MQLVWGGDVRQFPVLMVGRWAALCSKRLDCIRSLCGAWQFPWWLLVLGGCPQVCVGPGVCLQLDTARYRLILVSLREEIRRNRLWLLGIVQLWTCQGQRLVNDSFVGVAGGSKLLMMVMCCTGRDAGKYPASEKSLSGSG